MKFIETSLKGAFIIEPDKKEDERGFFARAFCKNEYETAGLNHHIVQINNSFSKKAGTLRGMHYQLPPYAEDKIVRCIKGAIYDVIIDLRPESPTFGQSFGVELNEENRLTLYVPKGFAHGNISLVDNTELFYLVTEYYSPQYERGIRWNDPYFNLFWPLMPSEISEKDKNHPLFDKSYHLK